MHDLVIEIGTEELPPSVIEPSLGYVKKRLSEVLGRNDILTYGTPRRLAFYIKGFENKREKKEEVIFGPPWKVAFDETGNPTKALEGFLKKYGAKREEVFKEKKGKGEYVAIKKVSEEKSLLEKLEENFEEILLSVPLPKRMRWTSSKRITFSRPVRWILALYGEEIVNLRFGDLRADRKTKGHRFLSERWITLKSAEDYLSALEKAYVIASIEERKKRIKEGLLEIASQLGAEPTYPRGLVEEVTNLVEYPFFVLGEFEERFLELPDRVIVTVCAHHQRFFCLSKDGKLINKFVGVSNNRPEGETIKRGYERVLKARLEDALFFYREDLKKRLEDLVPKLESVLVHPKVGSVLEKVKRMEEIARRLVENLGLKELEEDLQRAVYLSKADLLTEMVKEFDELQGYMGYIYALKQGEKREVAEAIGEHYKPISAEDDPPKTTLGSLLALTDKIDHVFSFFKAGEIPKGGSDPYGLRRASFGIIRILDVRDWDVNLRDFADFYGLEDLKPLEDFMRQRIESFLEGEDYDIVRAVLAVKDPLIPLPILRLVRGMKEIRNSQTFKDICEAYRRVVRILPEGWEKDGVREELLREEQERKVWGILLELERKADLQDLAKLRGPIDELFDNVLIMDKDEEIKTNRLALLMRIKKLFNRFGDFSYIVG